MLSTFIFILLSCILIYIVCDNGGGDKGSVAFDSDKKTPKKTPNKKTPTGGTPKKKLTKQHTPKIVKNASTTTPKKIKAPQRQPILPKLLQPVYKEKNKVVIKQAVKQYLTNHSTFQLAQLKPYPTKDTTIDDIIDNVKFQYAVQSAI